MGLFDFLKKEPKEEGLSKGLFVTKQTFFSRLAKAIAGKAIVDDQVLSDLEEMLITSDVGVDTSLKIIERVQKRASEKRKLQTSELDVILREEILSLLSANKDDVGFMPDKKPYVIMVVGVNGVGKTTTIGKLANKFRQAGNSVVLGAADTFRAAAVDQLKIWSERVGADIVSQGMNLPAGRPAPDPASVAFDTVKSAVAKNADVVIIDTAGRLHNKVNLMNELVKVKKVMQKVIPDAPHEILLVLDASTGQNAIEQCRQFSAATEVNAIALTKLDGTAKGGVVIGIADQFRIPIRYIGVGEQIDDLQLFNKRAFVESLFKK